MHHVSQDVTISYSAIKLDQPVMLDLDLKTKSLALTPCYVVASAMAMKYDFL